MDERLAFIKSDNELTLSETGIAVNPITKKKTTFRITGRAIRNVVYNNGMIRGAGLNIDDLIKI